MFESITFEQIDQEWAWSQLVGRSISIGKKNKYCSPLRSDSHPGVWFEWSDNRLLIVDFADKYNSNITCVTAWSRIKGIHWQRALREIYEKQPVTVNKIVKTKTKKAKEKVLDISITECWTKEHEDYWLKRGLSKEENVFGVCAYSMVFPDVTKTYICDSLCFAYLCEGKYKLYFPFKNKSEKFKGNQGRNCLWFLDRGSSTLLVSKSHKDLLVTSKCCDFNLTHIQGENYGHPDKHVTDQWVENHDAIYIWMDSDKAGVEGADRLARHINSDKVRLIFTPPDIGCKDADDVVVRYGQPYLKKLIQKLTNDNP